MTRSFFLFLTFLFCLSDYSFCQNNFNNKQIISSSVLHNSFSKSIDKDWKEIIEVLSKCKGQYSGINKNISASGLPDGPLLGNGNVGVVSACDNNWIHFYITTTDFWNGKHLYAKPLPIGGVNIIVNGSSGTGVTQIQNILDAEINTTINNGKIKIKSWVSATTNFFISEITSDNKSPVSLSIETWTNNTHTVLYPVHNGIAQNNIGWSSRQTEEGANIDWVCRAAIATKIIGVKYNTALSDNNKTVSKLVIQPDEKILIITSIVSGKNITDQVEKSVMNVKDQTKSSIEALHESHLNWWKSYWLKSYVRTYDTLLERYYFGALYEAACAYREGSICPGLFGPWIVSDSLNWDGNYTLSYNHQATVVGFASSNRSELLFPYMQQRYDWEAEGKKRAKRGDINFIIGNRWGDKFKDGIPGILEPITEGPWGNCAEDLYMGMLSGSVWGSLPIIWYCNYTQDRQYLSKIAYPYLKEVANFWEAYLVKENGKWVIKYAGDREWYPNNEINSAMDNAVVVDFFKNMVSYSKQLNVDMDKRPLWQDFVDNMVALPTGNYLGKDVFFEYDGGSIKEGDWPGLVMIAGHANAVTLSSGGDVKQRFINTIDAFNSWETPNAPGFLWASAIKGGYPEQPLLDRFKYLLTHHMRRNFTVPTGGHGTESVSSLDYINSMMLQSQEGFLRLFPAWPGRDAKFVRLRTSGAFLVSANLNKKQIGKVEIYSEKGGKCMVLNPWPDQQLIIIDGDKRKVPYSSEGTKIIFDTKPGSSYFLNQSEEKENAIQENKSENDIQIGRQIWMKSNLSVSTFRNGDSISEARSPEEWKNAGLEKKPAWCFYENNKDNDHKYGKLYNWWAVNDPRGLAPLGYYIPNDFDWLTLTGFLGGRDEGGLKMKNSLFNAGIGGYRSGQGSFYGKDINGYYWSSSVIFRNIVSNIVLSKSNNVPFFNYSRMNEGVSIRCVKGDSPDKPTFSVNP